MTALQDTQVIDLGPTTDVRREAIGGKARHLAQMMAEGFPVPPASVVLAEAYTEFMGHPTVRQWTDLLREFAESGAAGDELEATFDRLVEAAMEVPFSAALCSDLDRVGRLLSSEGHLLAVRSSGTLEDAAEATFSGVLTSFIGVKGSEGVIAAVRGCWLSAWRPRLLRYLRTHGLRTDDLAVAVIIQRLIPADRAGLVFTCDPANPYVPGVVVESTRGPGEDVVSGEVTPQRYVYYPADEVVAFVGEERGGDVGVAPGPAKDAPAGASPGVPARHLSDRDVAELAKWGLRAEELFQAPQDMEWVYGDGHFWVLQSRPIVLAMRDEEEFFPQVAEQTVLVYGIGASPQVGAGCVFLADADASLIPAGSVIVVRRLTNDLAVRLRDAAAVIAEEGGATSHGANLLREFGVPAVISTGDVGTRLRDGMVVTVDGFRGHVYEGDLSVQARPVGELPATRTKLFVSVLVPERSAFVAPHADGVSSLRNDYFLMRSGIHPREMVARGQGNELEETICRGVSLTAEIYRGKPVWYKTMDAPTDEFRRLAGGEHEPRERNPLLGWRGIGREIREPEMLELEVRAVARAVRDGHTNLGIKLPFIRFVSELHEALGVIRSAGLRPGEDVTVGVSVETPATALGLKEFLDAGAGFVSVGVSDLTMCVLALDRESHNVASLFDPAHPAVLELLERIVCTSREAGVFACATGESARSEKLLPHLLRMGYDAIGVSPAYFAGLKRHIAAIEAGD